MALRECPHCGNPVSDRAEQCPRCGHEFPENRGKYDPSSEEDTQFFGGGEDDSTQLVDDSQDTQYFDPNEGYNGGQQQQQPQNNDPGYNPYWNNKDLENKPQDKNKMYLLVWIIVGAIVLAAGGIFLSNFIVTSVTGNPEETVREYGKYFKDKVALDELDSLIATYPDISKADSVVNLESDTILVDVVDKGKVYDMTLTDGVTLRVELGKKGEIKVQESHGLFAYPENKLKIAKQTGAWEEKLNDAELNERMTDEGFFDWLQEQVKKKTSNIISLGSGGGGTRSVHNNTDQPIDAGDYTVSIKEWYPEYKYDYYWDSYYEDVKTKKYSTKGKAIPPHGSVSYEHYNDGYWYGKEVTGVSMKLSQDELQRRFAPYTGDEYNQYQKQK